MQRDIDFAMGGGSMDFDMEQAARDELSNEPVSGPPRIFAPLSHQP